MNSQNTPLPSQDTDPTPLDTSNTVYTPNASDTRHESAYGKEPPLPPPTDTLEPGTGLSPFWRNRLLEGGLILSMALYYVVGNQNLNIHISILSTLNPLYSLPFLLIFAAFCWYRLPFAIALLPLSLPYYLIQKQVLRFGHTTLDFSLAEITLWTCVAVVVLQLLLQRRAWPYRLSWAELRERIGPFAIPLLVFFVMAIVSIFVAYAHRTALRAFHEEVLSPLVYLVLALACLRTRSDVTRLLAALIGTGCIISVLAVIQYVFFKHTLVLEPDGIRRVHTVYGSANSIGLLLDYTLPIGVAWFLFNSAWLIRIIAALVCLPMFAALYLSQSHGAWIAIAVAILFIIVLMLPNRRAVLIGVVALIAIALVVVLVFPQAVGLLLEGHTNSKNVSTLSRRLYLWQSAWDMIRAYPIFGVGMDNWLCYYSKNSICDAHQYHYWIVNYPPNPYPMTGLRDEPLLSHPHNIFLHVWVSIGIFGLLAFIALLALFFRLFARVLAFVRAQKGELVAQFQWMIVGVGAAMVAAVVQGMGDSAFLEQDLAFCFWMLVTALLLLRWLVGSPWRKQSV